MLMTNIKNKICCFYKYFKTMCGDLVEPDYLKMYSNKNFKNFDYFSKNFINHH